MELHYGLHFKKFTFNILIENKPGAYSIEFIQAGNPLGLD